MYKEFVSYIRDLYGEQKGFIPLHEPRFNGNEEKYVIETIRSSFVSSVGEYVDRFEDMMVDYTGAEHAVAIVNGTNALHLALEVIGVSRGDEALTQALSFIATANAITYCGAEPHFIDVDKDTIGLSPIALKRRLEKIAELRGGVCYNKETNRKISACVPMHTFGLAMRIKEVIDICNQYNIPVVEDAAESIGTMVNDKHTGTFGKLGVFSFNGNKTITCGGGGAIVTDDQALAKRVKHLSTQAKIPHAWEYEHDAIGYNYRMPNLNAALACAQLEQLDVFITNKRATHKQYKEFFEQWSTIDLIEELDGTCSNYWLNAIVLESKDLRDEFLTFTNDNGVMTRPIWSSLANLPMFQTVPKGDLANAQDLNNRIVNITSSVRSNG